MIIIIFLIFFFFLGLCVGSFLNVVISRLQKNESILGRSYCDKCNKPLCWYELVPLFSFIILNGKCKTCNARIPLQYALVELSTGILFLVCFFLFFHNLPLFIFYLIIISLLIVLFVYDLKTYTIPDIVIYIGLIIALAYLLINYFILHNIASILPYFFAAIIASGFFAFLVLISKQKWMGWGDVEIAGLIGLLLGWPQVLLGLWLAFICGSICGIILIIIKHKSLKSAMPFGPFLIGAVIVLMLYPQLFDWFVGCLGIIY